MFIMICHAVLHCSVMWCHVVIWLCFVTMLTSDYVGADELSRILHGKCAFQAILFLSLDENALVVCMHQCKIDVFVTAA